MPGTAQCSFKRWSTPGARCFFLLALVLLTACSKAFLYNRLDWLATWYVDGYVDLTRAQKRDFKAGLQPLLDWHRREELTRYADLLKQIDRSLDEPVALARVQAWRDTVTRAAARIEARITPFMLAFSEELTDRQMTELTASLWDRQEEYAEEYLGRSDAEYREEIAERLAEQLDDLLGDLSTTQQHAITSAAGRLQRFDRLWLDDRAARLRRLAPLFARAPGWQERISAVLAARDQQRIAGYDAAYRHNESVLLEFLTATLNDLSPKQRLHLRSELTALQRDLQKLIAAKPSIAAG